jgi:hypothetical protein
VLWRRSQDPTRNNDVGGTRKKVKPREAGFLTAQTPFGMTKFFRQLMVTADFVDDFGDDGFV